MLYFFGQMWTIWNYDKKQAFAILKGNYTNECALGEHGQRKYFPKTCSQTKHKCYRKRVWGFYQQRKDVAHCAA